MLNRQNLQQHLTAWVRFELNAAVQSLLWVRSLQRWLVVDPKELENTHGRKTLSFVYRAHVLPEVVAHYFSYPGEVLSTSVNVLAVEPGCYDGEVTGNTKVITPDQRDALPQNLIELLSNDTEEPNSALWARSVPVGTVFQRKVSSSQYLYLEHLSGEIGQSSKFNLYQTAGDTIQYLGSWHDHGRVPEPQTELVFDLFGWPSFKVPSTEFQATPRVERVSTSQTWSKLPTDRVLGEAYPTLAPQRGTRLHFRDTPWTGGGELSFGAGSVFVSKIPWLLDELAPHGLCGAGYVRVPYTVNVCAIIDKWFEVENAYSAEILSSMAKTTSLEKPVSLTPAGWNLQVCRQVDNFTALLLSYASSYSLVLKFDTDVWYCPYSRRLGSFRMVVDRVSVANQCTARAVSLDDAEIVDLLPPDCVQRAKEALAEYKAELAYRNKARTSPTAWFVHWNELAAKQLPTTFVELARSCQLGAPDLMDSGRPWWLPPRGTVFRLKDKESRQVYVLLDKPVVWPYWTDVTGALAVKCQTAVWLEDRQTWQVRTDVLSRCIETLCGADAREVLRLLDFDFSKFSCAQDLYSLVPAKVTVEYQPCPQQTDDCFSSGGHGHRYHPVNFVHPVSTYPVGSAPPQVRQVFSTRLSVPPRSWTTDHVLHRSGPEGSQYLVMSDKAVQVHDEKGKLKYKISYSILDKNEGHYKDFTLADWGLNWTAKVQLHRVGSAFPGVPEEVLRDAMTHASWYSTDTYNFLPPNCRSGDILVQRRSSGTVYGVVTSYHLRVWQGSSIVSETNWSSVARTPGVTKYWGTSLSHLEYEPFVSPFQEGVVARSTIPSYYSQLLAQVDNRNRNGSKNQHAFLPAVNTLVFRKHFKRDTNEFEDVLIHFNGDTAAVLSITGRILFIQDLSDVTETYVFLLTLGLIESAGPMETYTTAQGQLVEVFERQKAPTGLSPAIYALLFSFSTKHEAPAGGPKVGHLYRIGDTFVFNSGTRISVFAGEADPTVVYLDDVTPNEAKLLAQFGFTVPVNVTHEPEVPTIVLHDPGQYPNPDELTATGTTLAGTYFHHSVLKDPEGSLWLWKQLPRNYHAFVVDAEECGSRIAYMLLGNKSVCAQKKTRDGQLGTLQPLLPQGSKLLGRDTHVAKLTEVQCIQLLQQHPVSWLISDHDAHGNQFMITPDDCVVGLDKGQCFKHFGDTERLALDYYPNDDKEQQGPYAYLVYSRLLDGTVDREQALEALAQTVVRIKFAEEAPLLEVLQPFVNSRFKEEADREDFINRFLKRKRNIDKEFDAFLSTVFKSSISLRHYARELKVANLEDIVFKFPGVDTAGTVEYETIPEEYHEVEQKTTHADIASKYNIKVVQHYTVDYLLAAMHNSKEQLSKFLAETKLKPVGNQETEGFKKTPYGYMVAIHKAAYTLGQKVTVKKEIKTHAKTVIKAVHAKGELPPTVVVAQVEAGKMPLHVVDYVPLEFAFKGKKHNFDDITVIGQVAKFPRGGANIFLGSPYVVNNYLNVLKVRVQDRFYYEVSMKVDQQILTNVTGTTVNKEYQFRARDYLPEKGVYEENSLSKGALTFANFNSKYRHFEDDAEIWIFNDSSREKFAMQGTVILRIPVSRFNTGARMDKVLKQYLSTFSVQKSDHINSLDELIVSPTEDSLKRITLMKAAFSRLPWAVRTKIDLYSDTAVADITNALAAQKVNAADLELAYLAEGHASTVHKQSARKLFSEVSSIRAITHGGSSKNVASVIKHGLLSPVERSRRGVTGAGVVASRDFLTGGAEMIMTMLGHMSGYASRSENVCYLVSPNQLNRTDLYFHNSDEFGSINPDETRILLNNPSVLDIIKNSDDYWASSNELIFWHSIPTTALLGVFCHSVEAKKSVVTSLKAEGIESVNGQSIEDFVHEKKDYTKMTKMTKLVLEA